MAVTVVLVNFLSFHSMLGSECAEPQYANVIARPLSNAAKGDNESPILLFSFYAHRFSLHSNSSCAVVPKKTTYFLCFVIFMITCFFCITANALIVRALCCGVSRRFT